MRAVKGNKEYAIDESQQKSYQDAGFDIVGDDGQVTAYGRGKTVPYDDYMKAVQEIGRLQECVADLEAAATPGKEPEEPEKEFGKKASPKKAGE